jgi:hypothetical protein
MHKVQEARNGHGFGRLKRLPDTRDYHASALLPKLMNLSGKPPRTDHEWTVGAPLDQGQTPECVAYTGAKLLYAGPVLNRRNVPDPETIYAACQANDEWAGTPHDGSSSRGLMKALQIMGFVAGYAFTLEIPTLCDWLANISPVAMGTVWTWQMETPVAYQRKSWLMIDPGPIAEADVAGGHEWLLYGVHRNRKCPDGTKGAARMINSWGLPFGDAGTAFVPLSLLQTLLLADGDCVMPTEIRKPAKAAA